MGCLFVLTCSRDNFQERMLDDMDDVHSIHSIGVVENPLYADHDGQDGASYAALKKKDEVVSL